MAFSFFLPRSARTWSLVRREARACRVAFTTLAWLAGTGGGGLQKHLAAAEFGVDFMRNRAVGDGDRAKLALGGFRSLADGVCHFIGLAEAEAYAAFHVSAHDEGGEGEAAAALDDLGATVDEHNLFSELGAFFHGSFSLRATASVTTGSAGSAAILAVTAGSAGSCA